MKTKDFRKIALMGIAAGLISVGDGELQAAVDADTVDLDYVIAKPKCNAHGGCGGLTAYRDTRHTAVSDEEMDDENDSEGDDEEEDEDNNPSLFASK